MITLFKKGELVEVLDTSTPKLFRPASILKIYNDTPTCRVQMLDCNDTHIYPINKIRKIQS
tara:strand:- start:3548 stop:3730 length:183 start_codon:yes stop_codon:yes gene_type:complete